MRAAQHAVVWSNVADRCKRISDEAGIEGVAAVKTDFLKFSTLAMVIASAYRDASTEFKGD